MRIVLCPFCFSCCVYCCCRGGSCYYCCCRSGRGSLLLIPDSRSFLLLCLYKFPRHFLHTMLLLYISFIHVAPDAAEAAKFDNRYYSLLVDSDVSWNLVEKSSETTGPEQGEKWQWEGFKGGQQVLQKTSTFFVAHHVVAVATLAAGAACFLRCFYSCSLGSPLAGFLHAERRRRPPSRHRP